MSQRIRLTQTILFWERKIIWSTWGELVEICGTWKWPVVLYLGVGTTAIIYSPFNKQSKFRPSLRPANRSGSTLLHHSPLGILSPLPISLHSHPFRRLQGSNLSKSISSPRSVARGVRFVCFNLTARFDNSSSYIRRTRGVQIIDKVQWPDGFGRYNFAPVLNRSLVVTYMGRVRLLRNWYMPPCPLYHI